MIMKEPKSLSVTRKTTIKIGDKSFELTDAEVEELRDKLGAKTITVTTKEVIYVPTYINQPAPSLPYPNWGPGYVPYYISAPTCCGVASGGCLAAGSRAEANPAFVSLSSAGQAISQYGN